MTKPVNNLDAELLRSRLDYDPDTGLFWWRTKGLRHKAGDPARGWRHRQGYIFIKVGGGNWRAYLAHRLAWLWMTGEWPPHEVDHANGITDDNRWCNLRSATRSQNCANARRQKSNISGLKGASFHTRDGVFAAQISKDGRPHFIGNFSTAQQAHDAYVEAARRMHGEFARSE